MTKLNLLDRTIGYFSPERALARLRARTVASMIGRSYDAAGFNRRTEGWPRRGGDANSANRGAITILRNQARDLVRNNGWARRGLNVIANNTVSYGIEPAPQNEALRELWEEWGRTRKCDASGRRDFYGIQRLVMRAVAESGECLVRRRRRRASDPLPIPLQLEVLEADYLDTTKDGLRGEAGGPIIQGVEYDALGNRAFYWLFQSHPGGNLYVSKHGNQSIRIPAQDVIHVFREDRPGQVRGITWFATAVLRLRDLDEYEDATLVRQKIAACFAAFVTDPNGAAPPTIGMGLGETAERQPYGTMLEPGLIEGLPPGKSIEFADPPAVNDYDSYTKAQLRYVAASLGITYEQLTGDYSNVNFLSGRIGKMELQHNLDEWRYDMLIPQLCERAWEWMIEAAVVAGKLPADAVEDMATDWTPPPMPMVDPSVEGKAIRENIRTGITTLPQAIRERGRDPKTHLDEYAEGMSMLDQRKIILDSDARVTTAQGQPRSAGDPNNPEPEKEEPAPPAEPPMQAKPGAKKPQTPARPRRR